MSVTFSFRCVPIALKHNKKLYRIEYLKDNIIIYEKICHTQKEVIAHLKKLINA